MTIALTPTRSFSDATADRPADVAAMLEKLNTQREARGLRPLALDPQLCNIARSHAVDMVRRNYFGHDTPEGASPFDRMKRAHYRFGYAGENIALNRNAEAAAMALWRSPEHRSNLLGAHYVRVGIAAADSTDGEIFVEDFSD